MNNRWMTYPEDHRMTQDECANIVGCSPATIAKHRGAGLLPYVPSRPIRILKRDFAIYMRLLANKGSIHRTLHIEAEDAAVYSRLDGVVFADAKPEQVIREVISGCDMLWKKYKALALQRGEPKARANRRRHLRLHKQAA